jgi:hypothetical protein
VIGRGKDEVRTFEVVVFGFERGDRFDWGEFLIHAAIVSQIADLSWIGGYREGFPQSSG